MSNDLERVQTEPHRVLGEYAVLFNNPDLLAEACHFHNALGLISILSGRIAEMMHQAPDDSKWMCVNGGNHRETVKKLKTYLPHLTPASVWLNAGFSKGELDFFLENLTKAQSLLDEKLRTTTINEINEYEMRERRHKDTAKIRARKRRAE